MGFEPVDEPKTGVSENQTGQLAVVAILIAVIGLVVWLAVAQDNEIYGPVREARARVEAAEQEVVDAQRDAAIQTLSAQIEGRTQQAGRTSVRRMRFEDCLAHIVGTAEATGQQPSISSTSDRLRVARFRFSDGDVMITCDRQGQTMALTHVTR